MLSVTLLMLFSFVRLILACMSQEGHVLARLLTVKARHSMSCEARLLLHVEVSVALPIVEHAS